MSDKDDKDLGKGFRQASVLQNMADEEENKTSLTVLIILGAIALCLIAVGLLWMAGAFS